MDHALAAGTEQRRQRASRTKQAVSEQREDRDLTLAEEHITEIEYRARKAKKMYPS